MEILHGCLHLSKLIKLCTYHLSISWYVRFVSIVKVLNFFIEYLLCARHGACREGDKPVCPGSCHSSIRVVLMLSWHWPLLSAPGLASLSACSGVGDGGSKIRVCGQGGTG